VNPAERVKFVVETCKAVIEERLPAAEAAPAVSLQAEQITPLLRSDRNDVTRSESESVATRLRMLAEQVTDKASGLGDAEAEPYLEIARAVGEMGQALR
jgi:hypothetical protein